MTKAVVGKCKFCGQEKKLIKAHIIPESFYLRLKEKVRYLSINSKTCKYTIRQNGGYDKNILCEDCDNKILGELDKEAYKVLLENFNLYEYFQINKKERLYRLNNNDFDYNKLRKFFISVLWRASVSKLPEWTSINLGKYEKKAFEILTDKKEYNELFKILIFKNCFQENINQLVLIAKGKTSKYKKYFIQMAGYRIEIMVDSSRVNNRYKALYEQYFLNPSSAYILETPEVSRRINKEHKDAMWGLFNRGFKPPKPPGTE